MKRRRKSLVILPISLGLALAGLLWSATSPAAPMVTIDKKCLKCHTNYKDKPNIVGGEFQSRSNKAKAIQVKVGETIELVKFTPQTKVENVPNIKSLKKPIPVMVYYEQKGDDRVATLIKAKPKIKVPPEQLMDVKELSVLVAKGPEKGGYTLIDSRPGINFQEGHIAGALSIPFAAMADKMDMLPKDKNQLVIFYCGGFR